MMSTETIVAMSRAAAVRAAANEIEPYQPSSLAEVERYPVRGFPFPNLGQYRPSGWTLVEYVMADSSGWGREDEPALTIPAVVQWVQNWMTVDETAGFAIIEAGQFQVVVGYFSQDPEAVACDDCEDDGTFSSVDWFECPSCGEAVEEGEEECYVCGWYKEDEEEEDEDEEEKDPGWMDVYQQGRLAFKDGVSFDDNPHISYTWENDAWATGYGDAKAEYYTDIQDAGQQTFDLGE